MGKNFNRYLRYIGIAYSTLTVRTCHDDSEIITHFHNMHLTVYETIAQVVCPDHRENLS